MNDRKTYSNVLSNKYSNVVQPTDYRIIPLTQGKFAKVDICEYASISKYNWQYHIRGYATNKNLGKMHRFIMSPDKDKQVDHINNDPLDNRRSNLRICNSKENSRNTRRYSGSSSKYKGVSYYSRNGKWRATIRLNNKSVSIGYFHDEIEAAKAYDLLAKKHFNEFAHLNFPETKKDHIHDKT
ncbi:AP2 domain-containing protein [Sphingobacterium faecium]|uniref:AP2 domain-containing protein n=1 Tax=Sphingobacterium faecium TaxID=34087 RepID=UPI00246940BC|nr:AP2 domain-containing protein [Sphingobacterium faecium]MDH5825800.1 AP2 domain-containing protein [Sphingobacterium faecium]